MGAVLAAELAEEEIDLGCLALWEPVVSGERYLSLTMRRSMMRKMLTAHEGGGEGDGEEATEDGAGIDFDGYLVPPELQADIRAIDLLAASKAYPGPTLSLKRCTRRSITSTADPLRCS